MLPQQILSHASLFGWLPLLGVALFAWWKGDWPERWGGLLNLFTSASAFVVVLLLPTSQQSVPMLVLDALLAFGFLALALIFASLWLGGAMLFQAAQFSLHAFYMVTGREHDLLYVVVNNVNTIGVLGMILIGTLASWRRRVQERRADSAA
ncbi:MAG: hypothetical protein IT546_03780 [Caulobacteraceae bacterium]|nr:hypothetical protein [Caulobacteraceae bacterium]